MSLFSASAAWLLITHVLGDWVQIPQSSSKKYLTGPKAVTEYTPYIYTPSSVFDVTTEKSQGIPPLSRPHSKYTRNPINIQSETSNRWTTSTEQSHLTTFINSKPTRPFINRPHQRKPWNATMINMQAVQPIVKIIKNKFVGESAVNEKPGRQPPKNFIGHGHQVETPPDKNINNIIAQKHTEILQEDSEFMDDERDGFEEDEGVQEDDDDEEYEIVYDDDEDGENYDPNKDDLDDEGRPTDRPQIEDEYYDEEEEEDQGIDDDDYEEESTQTNAENRPKGSAGTSDINGFSYAKLLPYLKKIQSTLIRNSHVNSVDNKVSFLTQIKDRILQAIKSRMSSIWTPWNSRHARPKRSTKGDMWSAWGKSSDHGMEFPSNEGALMTLGFLTFAAFLVKCILKLIHSFKDKHHYGHDNYPIIMVNGSIIGTTPMPLTLRFKREDVINAEVAKLMDKLESFTHH